MTATTPTEINTGPIEPDVGDGLPGEDAEQTTRELDDAAHELEHDLDGENAGALFDPAQYETEELRLPKIDGEGIDKISAKFSGRVWLDRADPADVALIRDVRMGQTVTLTVEVTVGPPVPAFSTNRDGDLDSLTYGRTFTVERVWKAVVE